mmetsp:Transcript_8895/g.11768  ORF Transcript_8895/g.11768 Transcript_8895/m.11768 type:complete len:526 (-) Transcript_8895:296-1873(-)
MLLQQNFSRCQLWVSLVLLVFHNMRGGFSMKVLSLSEYEIQSFDQWREEYSVEISESEYEKRLNIFAQNSKFIQEHNAKNSTYSLGHNQFSHLAWEEFRSLYLGFNPHDTVSMRKSASVPTPHHHNQPSSLPDSIDWTDKGAVTDIKDQGQCGSCWAFSAVEAIESALYIEEGTLVQLSPQEVVDCDMTSYGCSGGWMDNAFKFAELNGGLCTEEDYPYTAQDGTCIKTSCTNVEGSQVIDWVDLESTEAALMGAVSQQPIAVGIEADQMAFQFYSGGIFTDTCGTYLDHGVVVVGYGEEDGTKFWKVRNSWGSLWGEEGYIRLEREKDQYGGQCGVLLQASYPIMESAMHHPHGAADSNQVKPHSAAAVLRKEMAVLDEVQRKSHHHSSSSNRISASDCGGIVLEFDDFDLPSSIQKGSTLNIVAHGNIVDGSTVVSGTIDLHVKLDGSQIYSHEADLCGSSSISLPLNLGDIDMQGLNCPADDEVDFEVDFRIPIFAPSGHYSILAQDASDNNMFCVQIDIHL